MGFTKEQIFEKYPFPLILDDSDELLSIWIVIKNVPPSNQRSYILVEKVEYLTAKHSLI